MTVFDLIFLMVLPAVVVTLLLTAVTLMRRQYRRAQKLLSGLAVFVAAYFAVILGVSLTSPREVVALQEPQCFDDWCIAVDQVEMAPSGADVAYTVTLRIFSRARGRPQRENGVSVYLLDGQNRRYKPAADPLAPPLNTLLNPGESVLTVRRFTLPADALKPGLVVAHGRFPGLFIIGDDQSLLHKPTVVLFP